MCTSNYIKLLILILGVPATCQAQQTAPEWAHRFGRFSGEAGYSVAADPNGNIILTGIFTDTVDFDAGPDTFAIGSSAPYDPFLAKYTAGGDFIWAKALNCSGIARTERVIAGPNGDVFLAGSFTGTFDFDPGPALDTITANGALDGFFARYNSQGDLIWAKIITGNESSPVNNMHTGANGRVYVTGNLQGSADFDPGPGTVIHTSQGGSDIFIAVYDSLGNHLWSCSLGSTSLDSGNGIVSDAGGNVYVTGYFFGTVDFNPGAPVYNLSTSGGGVDAFITRFDSSGNFEWVIPVYSPGYDNGSVITINAQGNLVVAGECSFGVDFDPGAGMVTLPNITNVHIYFATYDTLGNYIMVNGFGGAGINLVNDLAVDNASRMYLTGILDSPTDLDPGPGQVIAGDQGQNDAFFSVFDSAFTFIMGTGLGSIGIDYGNGITADANGNAYVTGNFTDTVDFNPGPGSLPLASFGLSDIYFARYGLCITDTVYVSQIACDSVFFNGIYYATPGLYSIPIIPATGCDSVVILDLSLPVFDTTLVVIDQTISSNATGVSYQWIDCDNGFITLPGDTLQVFSPTANGNYAVILTLNGCSDTTSCVPVTGVGQQEIHENVFISLHPNPVQDVAEIEAIGVRGRLVSVDFYDAFGRNIPMRGREWQNENGSVWKFQTDHLAAGTYVVKVRVDAIQEVIRFVKY